MYCKVKNVKAYAPVKTYCKVCHDAGKPETEYRSHFTRETRDPNSNVTCPTLLSLECRYCYKNGHTVKYCPVLKSNEKQRKRKEVHITRNTESVQTAVLNSKGKLTNHNTFICLDLDSDEEPLVVQNKVNHEFPALCSPELTHTHIQTVFPNYAAALTKPAVPKTEIVVVRSHEANAAPWTSSAPKTSYNAPKTSSSAPKTFTMKSWADWSDSEDEDDEDDEDDEEYIVPNNRYTSTSSSQSLEPADYYESDW